MPLASLLLPCLTVTFVQAEPSADDVWERFTVAAAAEHGEFGRRAAQFLAAGRPAGDAQIEFELLRDNLRLALLARAEFGWAAGLDDEMFLNDVLPYAVLTETREAWRAPMLEVAREIVAGCTTAADAAQALNRELFDRVGVHYHTGRERPDQSPDESMRQGRASCTGLSILLVNACRAVGIPARVAGVASWRDKRGNHTWVEVWDGGAWRFLGADEFDAAGLDRGWFVADAAKAVAGSRRYAVWASSWRATGHSFPLVWQPHSEDIAAVDVTARYATPQVDDAAGDDASADDRAIRDVRVFGPGVDGERVRIAATVRIVDPTTGESVASVVSKAGQHDLNDMPQVEFAPGVRLRIEVDHDDSTRIAELFAPSADRATLELDWQQLGLSRESATRAIDDVYAARLAELRQVRDTELREMSHTIGERTLRWREREFGADAAQAGARSLWISMHGGGGAPPRVNDQQWNNQIKLYEPREGFYIAPRAPTDTWNLWHEGHIDPLFDRLIETYVALRGVDPDRVYLLGYSAGGDGVYQLAPRIADRFAAAAMMAGHPNEASPLGLRNLPFAIFMGGDDRAYQRNAVAAQWGERLAELQAADPTGYPHRVTIYPGKGHWMDGADAEALPWMAQQRRTPWPTRVVWRQDDVVHTRFYWLEVPREHARVGTTLTGTIDGQTIRIDGDKTPLSIRLHDALLDLDSPIRVELRGELVFEGIVLRRRAEIERSLSERADPRTAAMAILTLANE